MTASIKRIVAKAFSSPGFIAAVVVLAIAAVGLNAATEYLQLHFRKIAVPLPHPLASLPDRFGNWVQVSKDQPLPGEIEEALGAKEYIFRDYVDTRMVASSELEQFKDKTAEERQLLFGRMRASNPRACATLAVTYYTGMVDTVAHIPERCYVAGGYQPTQTKTLTWPIGTDAAGVDVRFIRFEDQTGMAKVWTNVGYVFHVNGGFESSPLGVRRSLQKLFERYGYYAKVEVMNLAPDENQSKAQMIDLLASAMPQIEKTLPDWQALHATPAVATATK